MGVLWSYPSFRVAWRVCDEQRWEIHTAGELYGRRWRMLWRHSNCFLFGTLKTVCFLLVQCWITIFGLRKWFWEIWKRIKRISKRSQNTRKAEKCVMAEASGVSLFSFFDTRCKWNIQLSSIYLLIACFDVRKILVRIWHCLRVRYRTSRLRGYGSGTGPLDTDSRVPVPDPEPRLWGLTRGPVVCETTTGKSRDTGPYLHV